MRRLALLGLLATFAPASAQIVPLGQLPPAGNFSRPAASSADGRVVVGAATDNGFTSATGFRWTPGTGMESLGAAPSLVRVAATAVSADGETICGSGVTAEGRTRIAVWAGAWTVLPTPFGRAEAFCSSISADGSVLIGVAGFFDRTPQPFRGSPQGAFTALPTPVGTIVEPFAFGIAGVSANGIAAVGVVRDTVSQQQRAVRWDGTDVAVLDVEAGTITSWAYALSADGSTAVGRDRSGAVRWSGTSREPLGAGTVEATGVSADGAVVTGQGFDSNQQTTSFFRWTAEAGVVYPALPLGWTGADAPSGVSADGRVIVGVGSASVPPTRRIYVWTPEGGTEDLGAAPGTEVTVAGLSADGSLAFGSFVNASNQIEAFVLPVRPPTALRVTNVLADTLLIPDARFRVGYEAGGDTPVHLGYTQERTPPASPGLPADLVMIGENLAPGEGETDWEIPFDVRSPHVRLVLVDTLGAERRVAYSPRFRVRPLTLTRLRADSTYQIFDLTQHGFASANIESQLFSPAWQARPEFRYTPFGSDPFMSGGGYPFWMPLPPVLAESDDFPDWPSYVRAFGRDRLYDGASGPRVGEAFVWNANTEDWGGSCFGFSYTALMVFMDPARAAARFPGLGLIEDNLTSTVGLLSENPGALQVVNRTQTWQGGTEHQAAYAAAQGQTVGKVVRDLLAMFRSDDGLAFRSIGIREFDGTVGSGAHNILPTFLRESATSPGRFNLFVYDSNHPFDFDLSIQIDTLSGGWRYDDPAIDSDDGVWFGFGPDLRLGAPVEAVFENATLVPETARAGGGLRLYTTPFADVRIRDGEGRTSGFADNTLLDGIPGVVPFIPEVGGPSAPVSFSLPGGAYGVTLSDAPGSDIHATVFPVGGGDVLGFAHTAATPASVDRLAYDASAGLRAANAAGDARAVSLFGLRSTDAEERLLAVEDLALGVQDSVTVQVVADAALSVRSEAASPAAYRVRLLRRTTAATTAFEADAEPLAPGAIHTLVPTWADLSTIRLDIDTNGDGTVDETRTLANMVAAGPAPALDGPLALTVAPNPSRDAVTVQFALPELSVVRVSVHDVLGREVAVLLDAERPAGTHAVPLDASRLAPGVYVVRLDSPGGVLTRRLTVAR
jgi:uncharacterized membrane protein